MASAIASRGLPSNPSLPAKVQPIPPNQTLYVKNVPSAKISKDDIRTGLYLLFSTYGHVLDIVAMKTMKMRGQAHITYRDIQSATQAMRALNGFEFMGKELQIEYSRSKSHFVSKLDGTYKMPNSSAGAAEVEVTDLQQSIFNAPAPGTAAAAAASKAPGLPSKPQSTDHAMEDANSPESRGTKRPRYEESSEESDGDVAMEEDSDDE